MCVVRDVRQRRRRRSGNGLRLGHRRGRRVPRRSRRERLGGPVVGGRAFFEVVFGSGLFFLGIWGVPFWVRVEVRGSWFRFRSAVIVSFRVGRSPSGLGPVRACLHPYWGPAVDGFAVAPVGFRRIEVEFGGTSRDFAHLPRCFGGRGTRSGLAEGGSTSAARPSVWPLGGSAGPPGQAPPPKRDAVAPNRRAVAPKRAAVAPEAGSARAETGSGRAETGSGRAETGSVAPKREAVAPKPAALAPKREAVTPKRGAGGRGTARPPP